jgi:hypothetical protein
MSIETETYVLPEHWLAPLMYGETDGLEESDVSALEAFTDDMVKTHGQCWLLSNGENHGFLRYHDAEPYGVLACDCVDMVFDVTRR